MQRVVATHRALQFGKLADHVRYEIGLGKERRTIGEAGVGAERRGDGRGDRAHAPDSFELTAELVVIDNARELRQARLQLLAAILIVKKLGIRKAGVQYALVTMNDRRRVFGLQIADQQESVPECSGFVGEGKILLILLHRQDQTFLRYVEERPVESACVNRRPFDQRGDLVEQRIGHDHLGVLGRSLQRRDDLRAAFGEVRNDLAFGFERRLISVGRCDGKVSPADEPVPGRRATRRKSERLRSDDVGAVQRNQAVRGSHELLVVVVRAGVGIAHDLGDGQLGNRVVERGLQCVDERAAFGDVGVVQGLGLAIGARARSVSGSR